MKIGMLDVSLYRKKNDGTVLINEGSMWLKCQSIPHGVESEVTVDDLYRLARECLRAAHRMECSACKDAPAPAVQAHAMLTIHTRELLRSASA